MIILSFLPSLSRTCFRRLPSQIPTYPFSPQGTRIKRKPKHSLVRSFRSSVVPSPSCCSTRYIMLPWTDRQTWRTLITSITSSSQIQDRTRDAVYRAHTPSDLLTGFLTKRLRCRPVSFEIMEPMNRPSVNRLLTWSFALTDCASTRTPAKCQRALRIKQAVLMWSISALPDLRTVMLVL